MQKKGAALRAVQRTDEITSDGGAANTPVRSTMMGPPSRCPGDSGAPSSGRAEDPEYENAGADASANLPARLDFTPVPRRYRHDGWTPERQVAFIDALADTGCVDRAARMVNMAQANCYALRRAPGAESFRRAWEAALDCGLQVMKDIAFERAIEGELIPVFSQGKLMGYRRKRNDALLMFCLRHYGQDAQGRRVTVNYFSTRASAGVVSAAGEEKDSPSTGSGRTDSGAVAEASATTVRTVISGAGEGGSGAAKADAAAALLNGFEGVTLDAEAAAAIARALEECAERARAAEAAVAAGGIARDEALADDPGESFFRSGNFHGALELAPGLDAFEPFVEGEPHWTLAGAEKPEMLVKWEEEMAAGKGAGAEEGGQGASGAIAPQSLAEARARK